MGLDRERYVMQIDEMSGYIHNDWRKMMGHKIVRWSTKYESHLPFC